VQPKSLKTEALEIYELGVVIQTPPSTHFRNPSCIDGLTKLKLLEALLQTELLLLCHLLVYLVNQVII